MKPTLTFSCPEDWDKMKIGLISRHCENCKRDVIDFTKMSKPEILETLLSQRNGHVCGRFYKSQLDYHHDEILITIQAMLADRKHSNLAFYLLAVSTIILLSCAPDETVVENLVLTENVERVETNFIYPTTDLPSMEFKDQVLLGFTTTDFSDYDPNRDLFNSVRILTDVMPEFPGGFNNMMNYIGENLLYPQWERSNGIDGMVIASFIVRTDGTLHDLKIEKSVPGAKHFDKEVLRLISSMPAWKPGLENGRPTDVKYSLPIRFKI
jgi:TonB family protein